MYTMHSMACLLWKQSKCLSGGDWSDKLEYAYTKIHYGTFKN